MKYFLLVLSLVFGSAAGFGQKNACPFPRKSITRPDRKQTQALLKTIDSLPLQTIDLAIQIPDFIKEVLNCWSWKNDWSIADRGQPYNATDFIDPSLPRRQLLYLGLNKNYMLITYNHGGMASNSPVLLFQFENEQVVSVVYWSTFNDKMKRKKDVIKTLRRHQPDPLVELHI